MKMKKVLLVILSIIIAQPVFAGKGRQPCSGKKGGIKHCTVDKKLVVSKCDVLTTYLSCLDCILIKIDARQLHDFLSSWKSLKFSV